MDLALLSCPRCRGGLDSTPEALRCPACAREYPIVEGQPDFLLDAGFEDDPLPGVLEAEERSGRHLIEGYVAPLLKKLYPDASRADGFRILSIGCGVGADVEALGEHGYRALGVDAGQRRRSWRRRTHPERFYLGDARALPFRDESFNFIVMGCLIPHIGVAGDTCVVTEDCARERSRAFDETVRVLKPGGRILISSPNRRCPLDLFHRPHAWRHFPRFHSPGEKFLLDFGDYERALVRERGLRRLEALPLDNYWGFYRAKSYRLGRVLRVPTVALFKVMSWEPARFLRKSFLNPWLVVLAQK